MPESWWRHFFHGVAVDLWLGCCNAEQTRAEAEFIERALKLPSDSQVLDVPCGSGRHSIELAGRGHRVTGVDLSSDFLMVARASAQERGFDVRWEQREMRDLPWNGVFDGAFCFGNSFGYLEHEENVAFLRSVARCLKPGGRFSMDSGVVAESLLPNLQARGWYEVGDIHMLIENRYDVATGRLITTYTFMRHGEVDKRIGSQQVYTYGELRRLLLDAGFNDCEAYSTLDFTPFELGAQRMLIVAQRE